MQNSVPKNIIKQLYLSSQNNRFQTTLQPKNIMTSPIPQKKKIKIKKRHLFNFQKPNFQKQNGYIMSGFDKNYNFPPNKELQNDEQKMSSVKPQHIHPFQKHLKESYKSVIPLKIFQTWHTKNLPKHMFDCVEQLKRKNPEFEHHLYDDQDCREFIKKHFHERVLKAFDKIIPGAYKADLWRYCVLYIEGGIYLDIKFQCINGFKLIYLTEEEHFVNDVPKGPLRFPDYRNEGIFNALMVAKPGNIKFKKCIDAIVHHTQIHFYGINCLSPTGPFLLRRFFTPDERKDVKLRFYGYKTFRPHGIHFKGMKILDIYPQYRTEKFKFAKTSYYGDLWRLKRIYR